MYIYNICIDSLNRTDHCREVRRWRGNFPWIGSCTNQVLRYGLLSNVWAEDFTDLLIQITVVGDIMTFNW